MATALYGKGREAFGDGGLDWPAGNFRAILIDTASYAVDIDVDEFVAAIAEAAQLAEQPLAGKTNTLGVTDADDIVFPALTTTEDVDAIVLAQDEGNDTTDRLVAYIDNAPEFPQATNGTDFTIAWDDGANKIFKL